VARSQPSVATVVSACLRSWINGANTEIHSSASASVSGVNRYDRQNVTSSNVEAGCCSAVAALVVVVVSLVVAAVVSFASSLDARFDSPSSVALGFCCSGAGRERVLCFLVAILRIAVTLRNSVAMLQAVSNSIQANAHRLPYQSFL
jgi:dipeptide/tripeptide permease